MRCQLLVNIFFAIFFNVCMYADDTITRGFIASQGSSTAVMTINASGVQQLSGNFTGEIVISASNVTLDLRGFTVFGGTRGIRITGSNVMVQNGTVRGATIGVRIEGNNNYLQGLDFISNTTGLEIVSNANMIENCNAFNNSSAGFSLVGANRNKFNNCRAIDNGSTGNAYGFVAQNGSANIFEECIAERTQTSGGSSFAGGFVLTGTEQKSKVLNCQANNASASTAAGIWAKTLTVAGCTPSLSLLPSATFNAVYQVWGVAWLNIGNSYYLASAGGPVTPGPEFRVLQFNQTTGILSELPSATFEYSQQGRSVSWLTIGDSYYLAATSDNTLRVSILQFNPQTGILSALPTATFGAVQSYSGSWLVVGSSYYLAVGQNGTAQILQFNPTTGVLTAVPGASYTYGGFVFDVNWQQIGSSYYLAIVGNNLPRLRVLTFNPSTGAFNLVSTFEPSPSEDIYGCGWLQTGTSYYIGTGRLIVRAVQFDPGSNTLTQRASNNGGWNLIQNEWLTIGDSYYLTGGSFNSTNNVQVFQFNPSAGTINNVGLYSYTIGSTPYVWQSTWQVIGTSKYVGFGGLNGSGPTTNPALVQVLNFDDCLRYPQNNIFMDNQSSGNVTGFQDDLATTTGLSSNNQWLGNFGANNTTNFNIGTQFPISAATGTGVGTAENIDASLITGGPAEKIMRTVVDQAAPAIAQVSTFIQCQPTYISGATTLSGNSYYALGRAVDGQITLNGVSNVSLNLMGRRVRNILVQNCSRISILNGYISGGSVISALDVDGSTNIHLQNLIVTGATYGLRAQNNATNITAENCLFNSNTTAGVQIDSGRGNSFMYCTANKNGTNGFVFTGTGHAATYCFANRNTAGAGFKISANSITNEVRSCSACVNATGYDFAITTSNIAISNFASGNTSANYVTNIRWGVTTASSGGSANYTSNVQI